MAHFTKKSLEVGFFGTGAKFDLFVGGLWVTFGGRNQILNIDHVFENVFTYIYIYIYNINRDYLIYTDIYWVGPLPSNSGKMKVCRNLILKM